MLSSNPILESTLSLWFVAIAGTWEKIEEDWLELMKENGFGKY